MIYRNKLYSIPDVAKRLKIKEKDIQTLIDIKAVPALDMFGAPFLKGDVILTLVAEIKKFNAQLKEGKLPKTVNEKGIITIPKGDLIND